MQSQVSEISPIMVEVKVEFPWERVEKDLNENFRRLSKEARVRGFRKGKIPMPVVKKLFTGQVHGQVAASLIEEGLIGAVQKHELQIVAQPEVGGHPHIHSGEPLAFTAKIEVRPTVDEVKLDGYAVEKPVRKIADEAIDNEIERKREEHVELRIPEPMRPAQKGDQLTIGYTVSVNGETKEAMSGDDRKVILGGDTLLEDFEKGLLGMQPEETKDIEVTFDDQHPNPDLKSQTAVFSVKVAQIHERVLPEVDDEFAKDCGDYETLEQMRAKIRADLEKAADARSENELKDALIDKLIELNEVPVPPSLVREEEQNMMYEFANFLQMTGMGQQGLDSKMLDSLKERAERKVRAGILLGAVARHNEIKVADEDVEAKFQEIAEQSGKHIAKVRVDYQGRRDMLENQILETKLMAFLRDKATVTEVEAKDEAEEAEATDAADDK